MKALFEISWKTVATALVAQAGLLLIGTSLFAIFGDVWAGTLGLSEIILQQTIGTALTVAVLIYPVRRSVLQGQQLFFAMFLAVFGINVLLMQIEAVAFLEMTTPQFVVGALQSLLGAAWITLLVVWVFGNKIAGDARPTGNGMSAQRWIGLLAAASVAYLVLYNIAGMLIYPFVEEYYAAQNFTAGLWLIPLQLIRGALYVICVVWILRSIRASRRQTGLAMAFMFPVLAGVAALIAPNDIMPDVVRHWHLLEIGWSNFAYGLLVGYLFWRPTI